MTTIKRLTGIARSGFEPMGAYGGIPTRRELGGWKGMAPRWKLEERPPALPREREIHAHGMESVYICTCLSFSAEHAGCRNARYGFLSTYVYM